MPDPSHIKDLIPDPNNRRKHTPRNIGMIVDALNEVGAGRSIVIDEANVVQAGNGVVEAAAEAGIYKVKTVEADGDEIVAVKRKNLTPEQKRRLAMYDNRAAELAEWDVDQLRKDQEDGADLKPFFTDKELKSLIEEAETVHPVVVPRPKEIVWVMMAIPMTEWPGKQAQIEAICETAQFSTMVIRPDENKDDD